MTDYRYEPPTGPDIAGHRLVPYAMKAYDIVADRAWIEVARAAVGLEPLSETLRPIDALDLAGLSWLTSYIRPHQDTLDRLSGNAAVIQSFVDTWQTVSTRVAEVQERLGGSVAANTAGWQGSAADKYRKSAAELSAAVASAAILSTAVATVARLMGEAAAAARHAVAELVTDLVQRLIRTVRPAMAAEGGLTSSVLAEATRLIAQYTAALDGIVHQLHNTFTNAAANAGSTDIAFGATRKWLEEFIRPTPGPQDRTRGAVILAQSTAALPARLSPEKLRNLTDDFLFSTALSTFLQYRAQRRYGDQLDWSSDGCSSSLDQPAGWNFLPACQRHDFGYRNYTRQGRFNETTRRQIDDQFYADLTRICAARTGDANYTECQLSRDIYYRTVRQLGAP